MSSKYTRNYMSSKYTRKNYLPARMKPLASAWAIFPPPRKPIFNMLMSMFNGFLDFFTSPSARCWSLTAKHRRKEIIGFHDAHSIAKRKNKKKNFNVI